MSLTIEFQPSEAEALYVADRLRERQASYLKDLQVSPGWLMITNTELSHYIWVVKAEGVPISILGIADFPEENTGLVWTMSTEDVHKHPISFTKEIINLLRTQKYYDYLVSFVVEENTKYQAFHDFVGFTYSGEVYVAEKDKVRFLRFDYISNKGIKTLYQGESL
jgi:hypothetical protein